MKIDMSVQMNEWDRPIGFSIKSRKPPIFPQGNVLEGRFSRLERFRSDHPMGELYEAFVRKQDESRWTYFPYGPFENFSDFGKKHDAINKILGEELATAKLDILQHSDDLLILIQD